jgi:uncharacterized protein (DUF433 family)
MTMNYQPYIIRDSSICGGEPVVNGIRVTVRTVLGSLAESMTLAEILLDFPTLDENAVRAVIAFAVVSTEQDLPVQPSRPWHEDQARRSSTHQIGASF